ncbi:MAG: tail fiber domain-containing protein [Methylococcales bacterium]
MNIDKKDRAQLKTYFVKNNIPKESEFAELIDGMLNQKDDGIAKLSIAEPLNIQAAIDTSTGLKKVINFYENFQDANPAWTLLLNPPNPEKPDTAKPGFCISDGQGVSRLFIDKNTGNIGIGTTNPTERLHVTGNILLTAPDKQIYKIALQRIDENERLHQWAFWHMNTEHGQNDLQLWEYKADSRGLMCTGDSNDGAMCNPRLTIKQGGNVGIGTTMPNGKLDIANLIRFGLDEGGSGVKSISFARDAGDETNAGKITYKGGFGSGALHIVGAGTSPRKIKLWDTVEVNGDLSVQGAITPSAGNGNNGIVFPSNPDGGSEDTAWIKYYSRVAGSESMTLEIGISDNVNDHIALMPSGGVGIGTVTPNGKLEVFTGGAGAWDRFVVNTTTQWGDGSNQHVTIGAGGAGGIMINNPHVPWIAAENRASIRFGRSGGISTGAYWDIGTRAGNAFSILCNNSVLGLHISENGKVGIGTNTPLANLSVMGIGMITASDDSNVSVRDGRMASGSLTIGNTKASYGGGSGWNPNTAGLMLETLANTEIAVHDSGERLSSLMYYEGDTANRINIGRNMGSGAINSVVTNGLLDIYPKFQNGIRLHEINRFTRPIPGPRGSGSKLIEVEEDTGRYFNIYYEGQGTIVFYHNTGVGQFMNASGQWNLNSDRSLKQNITATGNILDKVMKLAPVTFKWRHNQQEDIGFVAQDVEEVFPELVSSISINGVDTKALPYTSFGVLAIAAIQELVSSFEQRIKALEDQILVLSHK